MLKNISETRVSVNLRVDFPVGLSPWKYQKRNKFWPNVILVLLLQPRDYGAYTFANHQRGCVLFFSSSTWTQTSWSLNIEKRNLTIILQ